MMDEDLFQVMIIQRCGVMGCHLCKFRGTHGRNGYTFLDRNPFGYVNISLIIGVMGY